MSDWAIFLFGGACAFWLIAQLADKLDGWFDDRTHR